MAARPRPPARPAPRVRLRTLAAAALLSAAALGFLALSRAPDTHARARARTHAHTATTTPALRRALPDRVREKAPTLLHTEEEVEAVRPEEVEVEHIEEVKEAEIAVEVEVSARTPRGAASARARLRRPAVLRSQRPYRSTPAAWMNNLVVDEKHELVFCPVPKVACSNWKALLRKLAGVADYANTTLMHDKRRNGLRYLGTYSAERQRQILRDYYKAVFVRDPWSRLASAYNNKFVAPVEPVAQWTKALYAPLGDAEAEARAAVAAEGGGAPPFGEFARALLASLRAGPRAATRMNEHWAPAWMVCGMDWVSYDFVGTLEGLDGDVALLFDALGVAEAGLPSREAVGFGATHAASSVGRYYNASLAEAIGEAYAPDAEAGGYDLRDVLEQIRGG